MNNSLKVLRTWIALVATICATFGTARAERSLTVDTSTQDDSPILIDECAGGFKDSEYNVNYYFGSNCTVHVADKKRTATTIRFRFRFIDAFGEPIGGFKMDTDGAYAAGAPIRLWAPGVQRITGGAFFRVINTYAGAHSVIVSIDRVRFEDGSMWIADPAKETKATVKRVSAPQPTVPANYTTPDPSMTPTPGQ